MSNLSNTLQKYFEERQKLVLLDGWIGKSTSANILTPIYMSLRLLKSEISNILMEKKIQWTVQMSIGQGNATPDHYVALLPPGQKVSNGVFYCICFDRLGTGSVLGAMTSLRTNQRTDIQPVIRAESVGSGKNISAWTLLESYNVNVWGRNNGFFNPMEVCYKQVLESPAEVAKIIINHIDESKDLITELIAQRKTLF